VAFPLRGEKNHIQESGPVFWEHNPALSEPKQLLSTQVSSVKNNSKRNNCCVAVNMTDIAKVMMLMGNAARKMIKTVVVMVTVVIVVVTVVVAVAVVL
jgi:phage-related minor tail protein